MPQAEVVSSAILKAAAGTPLLVGSLDPNALLTEVSDKPALALAFTTCFAVSTRHAIV